MIRVLSTKKVLPNQKQFLLNAGFSVIEADYIVIKNKVFSLSSSNNNLILTSANAVKAVSNHPEVQDVRRNPAFCVGEKTADLLDKNGFTVQETAPNAKDLAEIIISQYASESFTFFSGNLRLDDLPEQLKTAGVRFNEVEVYETQITPQRVNATVDAILFFSPSAVESYLSQNTITNETCFCIGKTTAKALENSTGNIVIANYPSVENTIIQTINHYKKA